MGGNYNSLILMVFVTTSNKNQFQTNSTAYIYIDSRHSKSDIVKRPWKATV